MLSDSLILLLHGVIMTVLVFMLLFTFFVQFLPLGVFFTRACMCCVAQVLAELRDVLFSILQEEPGSVEDVDRQLLAVVPPFK